MMHKKKRCEDAIRKINEIGYLLSDEKVTLKKIEKEIIISNQYDLVFAQNRSQTWFRKYISEPFEHFNQWVSHFCQLKTPLEPSKNNTLEQFKQFKKGLDAVKQSSLFEAESKAESHGTFKP